MTNWRQGELDWTAAKAYGASGSPLMLIGTSVTGLLGSMHVISYRWALVIMLLVMVAGLTQDFLSRNRNRP